MGEKEKKEYTADEFFEMYQKLCRLTGWQIQVTLRPLNDMVGNVIVLTVVPFKE